MNRADDDLLRLVETAQGNSDDANELKTPDHVYFVRELNQFYDIRSGIFMSRPAVQQGYATIQIESETYSPATQIKMGQRIVDAVVWSPVPYGEKPALIETHGAKQVLNTYSPRPYYAPHQNSDSVKPWLALLKHILPDDTERHYLFQWLAALVQNPDRKPQWQVVLTGRPGLGKDALFYPLTKWLGPFHGELLPTSDLRWGDHFFQKLLVHVQEFAQVGNREAANILKPLAAATASELLPLNLKGGKIVYQRNLFRVVVTSNYESPVNLDEGDRRWLYLDALDIQPLPPEFYREYFCWLEQGGIEALIGYLAGVDIRDFPWGYLPLRTLAHEEASQPETQVTRMLVKLTKEGRRPFDSHVLSIFQIKSALIDAGIGINVKQTFLGNELRAAGFERMEAVVLEDGKEKKRRLWVRKDKAEYFRKLSQKERGEEWRRLAYP